MLPKVYKKVWGVHSLWYYGAYTFYTTIGHSENSPFCIENISEGLNRLRVVEQKA
jgi:hypothetical protein